MSKVRLFTSMGPENNKHQHPWIFKIADLTKLTAPRPTARKGARKPTYQDVERQAGETFGLGETPVVFKENLSLEPPRPPPRNRSISLNEEPEKQETIPCVFKWTSQSASAYSKLVKDQSQVCIVFAVLITKSSCKFQSEMKMFQARRMMGRPKEVFLTGSFNNWNLIPMKGSKTAFLTIIELPLGTHKYKFLVDGQFAYDPNQRTDNSEEDIYNIMVVELSDRDAFEALDIDIKLQSGLPDPDSNDGFGQDHPQSMDLHKKIRGPPVLPPHLLQVILNKDTPLVCEPTLLPTPNHVMINHAYALSIRDNVIVLSLTSRFRKKYVTTVLYKPFGEQFMDCLH